MLISCPNCATQFAVPDNALGAKGRTLKCARCGYKWFEQPPGAALTAPVPQPPPVEAAPPVEPPQFDAADLETTQADTPHLLPGFENFTFDSSDFAPDTRDVASKEDLTVDSPFLDEDDRMPAALSPRAPRRTPEPGAPRRGRGAGLAVALWAVVGLLVVLGLGVLLKDELVRLFPVIGQMLETVGLDKAEPGLGLKIRDEKAMRYERGSKEVLEVQGIIANVTDKPLDVPWLHIVLYDSADVAVMDQMHKPKVDGLDAGATTAFRVVLESPHPDAQQLVIQFVAPPEMPR